jgi:hypothetical protein
MTSSAPKKHASESPALSHSASSSLAEDAYLLRLELFVCQRATVTQCRKALELFDDRRGVCCLASGLVWGAKIGALPANRGFPGTRSEF